MVKQIRTEKAILLAVGCSFFLSSFYTEPVVVIPWCIGTVLVALLLGVSHSSLLVVSLPFTVYISLGATVNFSPGLLAIGALLFSPEFYRRLSKSLRSRAVRLSGYWSILLLSSLLASILLSGNISNLANLLDFAKIVVASSCAWIFIVWLLGNDLKEIASLVKTWLLVSTAVTLVGIAGYVLGMFWPNELTNRLLYSTARLSASFYDPNYFALYVLISLGIAVIVAQQQSKYVTFPIVILAVGVAMANSRGAFVALVVFCVAGALFKPSNWSWILSWVKTAIVVFLVFILTMPLSGLLDSSIGTLNTSLMSIDHSPNELGLPLEPNVVNGLPSGSPSVLPEVARSETAHSSDYVSRSDITSDVRYSLWLSAIKMWASSPVFGVGYGQFTFRSNEFSTGVALGEDLTHNTFLALLAESGLISLVLSIVPLVFILWRLLASQTRQSMVLFATASAAVVMMNAYNLQNSLILWLFWAALFVLVYPNVKKDHPAYSRASSK